MTFIGSSAFELRTARPGDAGAVRTVLVSAFGGVAEADLVDRMQNVLVLGPAIYYARFGFDADAAASFQSRYVGPHFMALRLTPAAPSNGIICYPAAFDQFR
jgi:predicted N-acetyltransferase YhbS